MKKITQLLWKIISATHKITLNIPQLPFIKKPLLPSRNHFFSFLIYSSQPNLWSLTRNFCELFDHLQPLSSISTCSLFVLLLFSIYNGWLYPKIDEIGRVLWRIWQWATGLASRGLQWTTTPARTTFRGLQWAVAPTHQCSNKSFYL